MTDNEAIARVTEVAEFYGFPVTTEPRATLITEDSAIVEKYPEHMRDKIGWWFVSISPDPPVVFGGEKHFYINDTTGKVIWQGRPWILKLIFLLTKPFRKPKKYS